LRGYGAVTQGATHAEALENINEVVQMTVDELREDIRGTRHGVTNATLHRSFLRECQMNLDKRTLSVMLLAITAPLRIWADAPNPALRKVERIFVGDMGQGNEAERFRMLLRQELSRASFKTVDKAEEADAVLTGVLVVRTYELRSDAKAIVVLKTAKGETVWESGFGSSKKRKMKRPSDPVMFQAQDIVFHLRQDWEEAGK
jgi:hypothetical protein